MYGGMKFDSTLKHDDSYCRALRSWLWMPVSNEAAPVAVGRAAAPADPVRASIASALLAVDGDSTVMAHGHRVQPQPLAEGRGVQLPGGSPEQYGILLFFIECRCDQERSNALPPPSHMCTY